MDEYIKFFFVILLLIIVAVLLYKYDSFTAIMIAFVILITDAYIITYHT